MRTGLNQQERQRVQQLWMDDYRLREAMWASAPTAIVDEFDKYVLADMESEGKHIVPGVANYYGGERAQRVMEMIAGWVERELSRAATSVRAVCRDIDYCAKRRAKSFENEGWTVAIAVGDGLLQIVTGIPIPVAVLSVYIIKHGILDKICECAA